MKALIRSILQPATYWIAGCLFALTALPGTVAAPSSPSFRLAKPGYRFLFPRDHGSHPAYATEWWYYTGQLRTADGRTFGYQLTWFRVALAPEINRASKWATRDIYFAHFALTDTQNRRFLFTDTIQRGALGLAGADDGAKIKLPKVWVGNWRLQYQGKQGERQTLRASGKSDGADTKGLEFALNLTQKALKPPVVHGTNGVSQKSAGAGHASHYYSFTRLKTEGTLRLEGKDYPVAGESWFDHEFGSGQMAPQQTGWDWFSLQLNDGRELMLYRLRLKNGGTEPFSSGTLIARDGRTRHLTLAQFNLEPLSHWTAPSGARYPAKWRIHVPSESLNLEVTPVLADQELRPRRSLGGKVAYWEGAVDVSGSVNGSGYVEMTGYRSGMAGLF